jgi:uncharacterized membrane protein
LNSVTFAAVSFVSYVLAQQLRDNGIITTIIVDAAVAFVRLFDFPTKEKKKKKKKKSFRK